jgi:hypothetical protein
MIKYIIIIGAILLNSCETKCSDDPDLNAQELSWFNCYTNGQIVIFKSNTGLIDTFTVLKEFEISVSGTDNNGCQHTYQKEIVDVGGVECSVSHYNQWNPQNLNSVVVDVYKLSNYTPQNNVIVNGITYNNVYVMDSTYYTKQNGILAFPGYPGVEWYQIN